MRFKFITLIIAFFLTFTNSGCFAFQKISKVRSDSTTLSTRTSQRDDNINKSINPSSMPWIIALVIGCLTVITNIFVSYNARKTSLEINKRDFNKTILSANRQVWISEFRSLMSEIISKLSYFISKDNLSEEEYIAFNLLLTKAELMISNGTATTLAATISKIQQTCSEVLRSNVTTFDWAVLLTQIKSETIMAIENEWDLVKKGA